MRFLEGTCRPSQGDLHINNTQAMDMYWEEGGEENTEKFWMILMICGEPWMGGQQLVTDFC